MTIPKEYWGQSSVDSVRLPQLDFIRPLAVRCGHEIRAARFYRAKEL